MCGTDPFTFRFSSASADSVKSILNLGTLLAEKSSSLESRVPARPDADPALVVATGLSIKRKTTQIGGILQRLSPEGIEAFVLGQLDRAGLGHNTFSAEAPALIVRSGEGLLRRTRNLCLGSLIEAVRDQTRIVDLKQVMAHLPSGD
jgi:hypothetical protein